MIDSVDNLSDRKPISRRTFFKGLAAVGASTIAASVANATNIKPDLTFGLSENPEDSKTLPPTRTPRPTFTPTPAAAESEKMFNAYESFKDLKDRTELLLELYALSDLSLQEIQAKLHEEYRLDLKSIGLPPHFTDSNGNKLFKNINDLNLGIARHMLCVVEIIDQYYHEFLTELTKYNRISLNMQQSTGLAAGMVFGKPNVINESGDIEEDRYLDMITLNTMDLHEDRYASGMERNDEFIRINVRNLIHECIHHLDKRQLMAKHSAEFSLSGELIKLLQSIGYQKISGLSHFDNMREILPYLGSWYAMNPIEFSKRSPELAGFFKKQVFKQAY